MKICTLEFLSCYQAQRVHGSKVEAKELTENSKAFELDELKFRSQRRMNRRPQNYIRRISSVAKGFKTDRRMNRRYR
jgi:thiamine biosynthesis lipoprotein ApbE